MGSGVYLATVLFRFSGDLPENPSRDQDVAAAT
jgi:hypothetical protein